MGLRGQLLLVRRVHMFDVVVPALPLQRNASVVPAVRDGGDHWAAARSAGGEVGEGGAGSQASGCFRTRDSDRRA